MGMLTGGFTLLLVRTMLKDEGSVDTEAHSILLSLLRSMVERSAGLVTWRAKDDPARARSADVVKMKCIAECR